MRHDELAKQEIARTGVVGFRRLREARGEPADGFRRVSRESRADVVFHGAFGDVVLLRGPVEDRHDGEAAP